VSLPVIASAYWPVCTGTLARSRGGWPGCWRNPSSAW